MEQHHGHRPGQHNDPTGHHDHHAEQHAYFDSAAATWDEPDKVQHAADLAAAIIARVPLDPDWVVLDFGAGTGLLSVRLAPLVREVDMVDTSAGMLDAAERRRNEQPNLQPVRRDLASEPAPRDHYDLVTASLSLHHVPEADTVLDVFARVLTPGGWIAIAELGSDPGGDFHGHLEDFSGHHGFDPADLGQSLTSRGFTSVATIEYGTIPKEVDGQPRDWPVHLITGQAPRD